MYRKPGTQPILILFLNHEIILRIFKKSCFLNHYIKCVVLPEKHIAIIFIK